MILDITYRLILPIPVHGYNRSGAKYLTALNKILILRHSVMYTFFCRWTRFLLITCMSMAANAPVWSTKINIETYPLITYENSSSRNAIYGQFYLNQEGSDNVSVISRKTTWITPKT